MWFKQEAAYTSRVQLPNGHSITLDFVLDDTLDGYLASENGYVVNQIRTAINSRTGGWVEVTQAEYDAALKKKVNPQPMRRGFRSLNAGMFPLSKDDDRAALAAAVADKPDPISVPTPEQMKLPPRPRVGRLVTT